MQCFYDSMVFRETYGLWYQAMFNTVTTYTANGIQLNREEQDIIKFTDNEGI